MTVRKVLVEFELDPTDYGAILNPDSEAPTPLHPEGMPDTQEAAHELIQEMFKGNVDICDARIVGNLVLLFTGQARPDRAQRIAAHLDSLAAIIGTLQEFHRQKPFQQLKDMVSVTCIPPQPGRDYYEVKVWRQPLPITVAQAPLPNGTTPNQ